MSDLPTACRAKISSTFHSSILTNTNQLTSLVTRTLYSLGCLAFSASQKPLAEIWHSSNRPFSHLKSSIWKARRGCFGEDGHKSYCNSVTASSSHAQNWTVLMCCLPVKKEDCVEATNISRLPTVSSYNIMNMCAKYQFLVPLSSQKIS